MTQNPREARLVDLLHLRGDDLTDNNDPLSAFKRYEQFPYEAWAPNQVRVEFVTRYAQGERLLDIACGGIPVTIDVMGLDKVGMDISPKAYAMGKGHFDSFYLVDFEATAIPTLQQTGQYDTIVASEFLEHTIRPAAVLHKMKALMKKKGRLIVTVPSGESLAMQVDKALHAGEWGRFEVFHKNHISLLSQPEWEATFERVGLQIDVFDFRPTDIVEGFPSEKVPLWKTICGLNTQSMAHQYMYVLKER